MTVAVGPRRPPPVPPPSADDAPSPSREARAPLPGRWHWLVLGLLALQFVGISVFEAAHDSATVDEAVDITSGITIIDRHDFRISPEHGPLPKVLSALPALAARPVIPTTAAYRDGVWFDYVDDFVSANEAAGRLDTIVFLARLTTIAEGVAIAGALYALGRRAAGPIGGTISAGLWLTTPVFVGFSHIAGLDIPFTLAVLGVSLATVRYLERSTLGRAAIVGGAAAAATLVRHNALAIAAVAAVVIVVAGWRDRRAALKAAGVAIAVVFATVWAFYRVLAPVPPSGPVDQRYDALIASARARSVVARVSLAAPLPKEFDAGLAYLFVSSDDRPAYAFGQAWTGGRWWFFPASAAAKIPFTAFAAVGVGAAGWRRLERRRRRLLAGAVVPPAAAVLAMILAQPLDLGLRYAFPVVATAFVAAAPVAGIGRRGWRLAFIAVVLITQSVAVWVAAPHSIAWTPPPFRPAYRFVSDSNVDYGQDIRRFNEWARDKTVTAAILRARGLPVEAGVRPLLGAATDGVDGWVAVSVTELTVLHRDQLAWLRAYCPVGSIGGSILLYRFAEPPSTQPGPMAPAAYCAAHSGFSVRVTST